ncbi:MAG: preprotein translocase subunit SecA, partial [Patescibacteria group bacterium]
SQDAKRDLGVTIEHDFLKPVSRKDAYRADITYGTNNEFGFDYLRDNMVMDLDQKVQRELHYAIIDEVDSILIDEARTPLIISAPDAKSTDQYYQFAQIVNGLDENTDYNVDEKMRAATLTESGVTKVEKILNVENIYVEKGIRTIHHIEQALRAKALYRRDKDYTVKDGQVLIVDEFTGRLLPGRRYSEGLHQAIEAKESLEIQRESRTMATITFQNYFRLYHKLAGMTGTAETEAEELAKIYNLDVTTIPTNKPMIRKDHGDRIYKSAAGKFSAVVQEIKQRNSAGQPVLVGTISIEKNELLAQMLEREGLRFNLLNAKQHEKEAETIAQAGSKAAITIATNMAGRGVDIKLGGLPFDQSKCDEVIKLGGLHVIGTERHESRRIHNQLRGRSGRQGEPGSSQFYVSLDDDLMRIFGAERVKMLMKNWPEDMPIENSFISKSLESAQKKVEGHNFDIRKHLVEYDDVINKQRTYAYNKRDRYLMLRDAEEPEVLSNAKEEIHAETEALVAFHTAAESRSHWNTKEILESAIAMIQLSDRERTALDELLKRPENPEQARETLVNHLCGLADARFDRTVEALNKTLKNETHLFPAREIITTLYLRSLDMLWVEHLETINYLRTGIGLRGYGQRDPLVEYKRESKDLFSRLLADIQKQFVYSVLNLTVGTPTNVSQTDTKPKLQERKQSLEAFGDDKQESAAEKIQSKPKNKKGEKIGRNDPCHCGSGKKFKKCHGA